MALITIKKSGTGTKSTEIHVAPPNYNAWSLQVGTPLHETDATFDFAAASNGDLFCFKKQHTGTNSTEIHVLSAANNYQSFILQTGTCLHQTDENYKLFVLASRDVLCVKKRHTGTNSTEVHILTASSNYSSFRLQVGTGLHETGNTFAFGVASNDDLFIISKSGTGTKTTEVHVLSAASNYSAFTLHTGSCLHETDDNYEFVILPNRNVMCLKKRATGTNSTEVHILSAAHGYQAFSLQSGTCLHETGHEFTFACPVGTIYSPSSNGGGGGFLKIVAGVVAGAVAATLSVATGGIAAPLIPTIIAGGLAGGVGTAVSGTIKGEVSVPLGNPTPTPTSQPQPQPTPSNDGNPVTSAPPVEQPTLAASSQPQSSNVSASVLEAARRHLGESYSQIDCSHLVHQAFVDAGLSYPYTTTANWPPPQFAPVTGEPQPGDIVKFPGHIGIVIGDGVFFGSQSSTGPAEAAYGPHSQYWGNTKPVEGYYRWKGNAQ